MPSLKDIKNRIKSVKEVQQITKAMKMVAAAKLRKSEATLQHVRRYMETLEAMVFRALSHHPAVPFNVFGRLEINRSGLMVLSGDKGLCGGFNSGVVKQTLKHMDGVDRETIRLFGIGKKGNGLLKRQKFEFLLSEQDIFGKLTLERAFTIRDQILEAYNDGQVDEVYILFNRFKPKADQDPMPRLSLLPIVLPDVSKDSEPLYEPSDSAVLSRLLPYYLGYKIYHYLLESEAAEFLARMTAMDSASDNAADLIAKLTLDFNRARQASITGEILEIVGGAEALK